METAADKRVTLNVKTSNGNLRMVFLYEPRKRLKSEAANPRCNQDSINASVVLITRPGLDVDPGKLVPSV